MSDETEDLDVSKLLDGLTPEQAQDVEREMVRAGKAARPDAQIPQETADLVNYQGAAILAEHGVQIDVTDPDYIRLVAPHTSGAPSAYLSGLRQYAEGKKRAKTQGSLKAQYKKAMDAALDRNAGALEKHKIRAEFRDRGLEI
jgi:hypothetical protein